MKTLLSLTLIAAASVTARAGAPASAPVVDTTSASASATYTPKHKSVFTASVNDHNPFWPIGWVKTEAVASSDDSAPTIPRAEDFTVSTILLNEPPMAVINGKDMAEGEVASLSIGGRPVMVQLMAVQDGRVILRWQNQNIIVPLHRDEDLSSSAPDPATTVALH